MKNDDSRLWPHLAGVALLAALVVVLFLKAPGFGDDLTYWRLAFELHDQGGSAWDATKFHHLRWPVWGVCWLLQIVTGPGLLSFYGEPVLYMATGALLAFYFGRRLLESMAAGWGSAVAFLFHPLLDTVNYRPMPDLSEGVWGAAAVACWLAMMEAGSRGRRIAFCGLTGLVVAVAFSNRITGIFIVAVLVVATLLFHSRRVGWLAAAGAVALAAWCVEALIYWRITGDFFHSIHANLGARGRKGTESVALWALPFRFVGAFWRGNVLAPFYTLAALAGGFWAWCIGRRLLVVWAVVLYLAYSCALQSVSPLRPLLRDADRFLAALAVPLSVLAVAGVLWGWSLLVREKFSSSPFVIRHSSWVPPLTIFAVVLALIGLTSRHRFDLDFVPELRSYVRERPAGTRVLTHDALRAMVFLVAPDAGRRIEWSDFGSTLLASERRAAEAEAAEEFWYIRKIVWLGTRKRLEQGLIDAPEEWARFFTGPAPDWRLAEVIRNDASPDFVFYQKRQPDDPPPQRWSAGQLSLGGLPLAWQKSEKVELEIEVPPALRGTRVRLETRARADQVQAATAKIAFGSEGNWAVEYLLKPYFHPFEELDFFAMEIPSSATRCRIQIKIARRTQALELTDFQLIAEPAEGGIMPRP